MEDTNVWQNEGRKQPKFNNGNRVEFRLSKNGSWIYESMVTFFWQKGYISKPTLGEAARFSFNVLATNYMDQGETITQKLKGITPATDCNKLEKELASTESELAVEKQTNSLYEMANEANMKAYETQSHDLENLRNTLKNEETEFSDFREITSRIGERIQEMAKEGGYLEQEVGQVSEAPRIILKEEQSKPGWFTYPMSDFG